MSDSSDDDGAHIDPSDVPIPGLCRLCTQYLDPDASPDSGILVELEREEAFVQSMQLVHCTLTRMDHALDENNEPRTDDAPFTCPSFRSRFGTASIWH